MNSKFLDLLVFLLLCVFYNNDICSRWVPQRFSREPRLRPAKRRNHEGQHWPHCLRPWAMHGEQCRSNRLLFAARWFCRQRRCE
jgi:hypothetical protein